MNDFYITLPSNVPNAPFPNTSSRYVTRLPEVLHLKRDEWKVALTDLVYPYSFVNVGKPLYYWIHFKSNRPPIRITFPSAQYRDLDSIILTLNKQKTLRLKRSAVDDFLSRAKRSFTEEERDDMLNIFNEEAERKEKEENAESDNILAVVNEEEENKEEKIEEKEKEMKEIETLIGQVIGLETIESLKFDLGKIPKEQEKAKVVKKYEVLKDETVVVDQDGKPVDPKAAPESELKDETMASVQPVVKPKVPKGSVIVKPELLEKGVLVESILGTINEESGIDTEKKEEEILTVVDEEGNPFLTVVEEEELQKEDEILPIVEEDELQKEDEILPIVEEDELQKEEEILPVVEEDTQKEILTVVDEDGKPILTVVDDDKEEETQEQKEVTEEKETVKTQEEKETEEKDNALIEFMNQELEAQKVMKEYMEVAKSVLNKPKDPAVYRELLRELERLRSLVSIDYPDFDTRQLFDFSKKDDKILVTFVDPADVLFLEFDKACSYFLGFEDVIIRETMLAPHEVNFFGDVSVIYLYSDIVEPIIVGNKKSNLLSVIPCTGKHGSIVYYNVPNPRYVPIANSTIDSLRVELLTDGGHPIPFSWGTTIAVLHFKKLK